MAIDLPGDACFQAIEWCQGRTERDAWDKCSRANWMVWILGRRGADKRRLVTVACKFARYVLHLVPVDEPQARLAIEAAEAWLRDPCHVTAHAAYAANDVCNAANSTRVGSYASAAANAAAAAAAASDASCAAVYATNAAVYAAHAAGHAAAGANAAAASDGMNAHLAGVVREYFTLEDAKQAGVEIVT